MLRRMPGPAAYRLVPAGTRVFPLSDRAAQAHTNGWVGGGWVGTRSPPKNGGPGSGLLPLRVVSSPYPSKWSLRGGSPPEAGRVGLSRGRVHGKSARGGPCRQIFPSLVYLGRAGRTGEGKGSPVSFAAFRARARRSFSRAAADFSPARFFVSKGSFERS